MQKEEQKFKEEQILKEIQYYIFQDLENVLCLIGELEQTIHTLQNQDDYKQSYLPIATNKTILQANISNGIHLDQYYQHNKTHKNFLEECNNKARQIFEEVKKKKGINATDPKIQEICDFYLNKNLKAENSFYQLPLLPVSREAQFNQQALEKVIWGTQTVNNQLNDLQNSNYQPPTVKQILEKINQRKKYCEEQLIKNFGINQQNQPNETKNSENLREFETEEDKQTLNDKTIMQDQNSQVFEHQQQKNQNGMQIEDESTEQNLLKNKLDRDGKSKENTDPNKEQQQENDIQIEDEQDLRNSRATKVQESKFGITELPKATQGDENDCVEEGVDQQ
ncbi:unnamed protein product [Paramecium pentaurelia]|uniref:Uncharacterized protein n=1 Tax=Paramecium pentaurelia TaxID=43138 RepID=A0A8S1T506_9CILI|nr:unnamed protein product [Paramecium pentaurelia]